MPTRRAFLAATAALGATGLVRRALGDDGFEGDVCHPVEPPPAMTFTMWEYEKSPFYGGPSRVIAAVPKVIPPGGLPLAVFLPGGHHNMQGYKTGVWGWWDEYKLGEVDAALRRGGLDDRDFRKLSRPSDLARFDGWLSLAPYRGMVLLTPWVVGRQLQPGPHGTMVAEFLRMLVERARAELPVIGTRQATGVAGMSSGGLWAIFSGSACADLFSTVVGIQPFTEELLDPLRAAVLGRSQPQRLRMLTSKDDHQRESTEALVAALVKENIPVELEVFRGAHSAEFAAGPGGLDALLTLDRALRGESMDGSKPLPARDALALSPSLVDDPRRTAPAPAPPPPASRWPLAAAATAVTVAASYLAARARRAD